MIGRLKASEVVFFCCDIQEKFVPLIHNMSHVIHTAKIMTSVSNLIKIPIIVTEQYPKAFGRTVPDLNLNRAVYALKPVEKRKFSMITDEVAKQFDHETSLKGRRCAVLYGIEAHVCVQQTALDLLERKWDVHVLADGVSSQRATDRAIALERMRQAGAFITTSESACFMIAGDADQPYFKEMSSLFNNSVNPRPQNQL